MSVKVENGISTMWQRNRYSTYIISFCMRRRSLVFAERGLWTMGKVEGVLNSYPCYKKADRPSERVLSNNITITYTVVYLWTLWLFGLKSNITAHLISFWSTNSLLNVGSIFSGRRSTFIFTFFANLSFYMYINLNCNLGTL